MRGGGPGLRILIFCQDIPPTWGLPTAGGGVRCWGLAQGLAHQGHEVIISVPARHVDHLEGVPEEARSCSFQPGRLMDVVERVDPQVVITVQWPLAGFLEGLSVPLVIDLYGPLLLENLYYTSAHWESLVARKTRALYLGDFFLCGSQRQLAYFLPWLLHAGVPLDRAPIHVAPLTMPPRQSHRRQVPSGEIHFVAAGVFWPWQNPAPALAALLEALDEMGCGRLTIVGGPHPQWKQGMFPGEAPSWPRELLLHPRVSYHDLMPWDSLNRLLDTAHVGVDLSLPNVERFLAAPTRVYHYLWRGLPVLLSDYLELAPLIHGSGAGWAVDPTDPRQVKEAVRSALRQLDRWERMSAQACQLVASWEEEPRSLYEFCRAPSVRPKAETMEQRIVGELVKVYRGLGNAEAELEHLRKDVRDRDRWLAEANERLARVERDLFEANERLRSMATHLAAAEERLAKVRRSLPYRCYRAVQVLIHGPDEVRVERRRCRRSVRKWVALLAFSWVGLAHLLAQGLRKWKDVTLRRAKAWGFGS